MSAFTLRGKSLLHYAVLAGALCTLTVTLVALVVCICTRMKLAKWRWILFILVGIGNFSVNWFTGEWTFAPLSILLFSAGAVGQLYMPWIVSVAAPVGAILFLARRKALAASASEG